MEWTKWCGSTVYSAFKMRSRTFPIHRHSEWTISNNQASETQSSLFNAFSSHGFLVSWIEIARCSKASRFEHSILRWIDENLAPSAIEITTKSSVTCDMEIGNANSMDKSKLNEANVSDLSLWICENEAVFMSLLYLGHIFFCTFFGDSPCSLYCSEYCGNHFAVRREIVFSNFG